MPASKISKLGVGRAQVGENLKLKPEDRICPKGLKQTSETGITFADALHEVIRKGRQVRRVAWPDDHYLTLKDGHITYFRPGEKEEWCRWTVWVEPDLLATDWRLA